jgi:sugar lactone lactonase YvrE
MSYEFECLVDTRCQLGESPVWDAARGRVLWADIEGPAIHAYTLADKRLEQWPLPSKVGSFGLCQSGRLVVGLATGVYVFDPASGALDFLVDPEPDLPTNRLNDGKVGPDGAFWVGSMDERPEREPVAALYRVTADGACEAKITGLTVSNGIAWSSDARHMFHSDSRGPWIDRYDFAVATGGLSNRTRIAELTEEAGRPDGAATDVEGTYWSCGISAGCLNRLSDDGALLQSVPVPVTSPTMVCFGGTDMRTMFLTSLRVGVGEDNLRAFPETGGLHAWRCGVEGVPIATFDA